MISTETFTQSCVPKRKMTDDRRRRTRVQGNWASPTAANQKQKSKPSSQASSSALDESSKNFYNRTPAWLGKNVDNPLPTSDRYFYEPQEIDFKEKPNMKIIDKAGIYDISTEPSGLSRIRFFPEFLEESLADNLYKTLTDEIPWQQMTGMHKGNKYREPRLNAFYGEVDYEYGGVVHPPSQDWPSTLKAIKTQLEEQTGLIFNGILLNLYRNEHDSVAWHCDDEPVLGPNPTVVSVSLGATRNFSLRRKPSDGRLEDVTNSEHIKFPLPHGSLIIMEGSTQDDWQHCIPKEYHHRDPRINLTFRYFIDK